MKLEQLVDNYNNQTAQFYKDLASGKAINVNGKPMFMAEYNMIISKRDFGLFAIGLKPHRRWKFNDTKKYFGLKGNAKSVSEQIKEMVEIFEEFKAIYAE
jgi:hypothetical protein